MHLHLYLYLLLMNMFDLLFLFLHLHFRRIVGMLYLYIFLLNLFLLLRLFYSLLLLFLFCSRLYNNLLNFVNCRCHHMMLRLLLFCYRILGSMHLYLHSVHILRTIPYLFHMCSATILSMCFLDLIMMCVRHQSMFLNKYHCLLNYPFQFCYQEFSKSLRQQNMYMLLLSLILLRHLMLMILMQDHLYMISYNLLHMFHFHLMQVSYLLLYLLLLHLHMYMSSLYNHLLTVGSELTCPANHYNNSLIHLTMLFFVGLLAVLQTQHCSFWLSNLEISLVMRPFP